MFTKMEKKVDLEFSLRELKRHSLIVFILLQTILITWPWPKDPKYVLRIKIGQQEVG